MLKRTLFFTNPYHLKSRNIQLVIKNKATDREDTIPIEDIGFIVMEHPQITFTQSVIQLLAENNTAVIFCNNHYMPSSMLLHLYTNQVQAEMFRKQITASIPLKNNIWKQTVQAKIRNQAYLLKKHEKSHDDLLNLCNTVKSGDKKNVESLAARIYWRRLMGINFNRAREGDPPNNLLNYGYTVLRAAVARALSGSGLLPTLGLFHKNRYNDFALADDIMEPYRPYVDHMVLLVLKQYKNHDLLNKDIKKTLLGILTTDVEFENVKRPLMVGLSHTSASLVKCFCGEQRKIEYPVLR